MFCNAFNDTQIIYANRFPLIMNIIQFWIVDTIVKHKARSLQLNLDEEDNMLTSDDEYENRNEQDETNLQPFDNKIR